MAFSITDQIPLNTEIASAAQTVFTYTFPITDASEILVYLTPAGNTPSESADLLILNTDYTVTGVNTAGGGTVVLTTAAYPNGATANDMIVLKRDTAQRTYHIVSKFGISYRRCIKYSY